MKIGTRLYLSVTPAVIGVVSLAGLAYWGEYGRQAPEAFVVIAAIATVASLIVAWRNTRYVAGRIERLAAEGNAVRKKTAELGAEAMRAAGLGEAGPDEIDSIERLVHRLASSASAAERSAKIRVDEASEQQRMHAALLRATAADLAATIDQVRLPLHILLDNHFGDLNENQEEMLGAARAATDTADQSLRRVITVLTASDGTLTLRRDRIHSGELVEGLLAPLRTRASECGLRMEATVEAPLPSLTGDRALLQEGLRVLFEAAVSEARGAAPLRFHAAASHGLLQLSIEYAGRPVAGVPLLFGEGIARAHGGEVRADEGRLDADLLIQAT